MNTRANLQLRTIVKTSTRTGCALAAALLCGTTTLLAQSGSELGNSSYFSTVGQGDTTIVNAQGPQGQNVADNSCVPTADANGMAYLENYWEVTYDQSLFTAAPGTAAQVNTLIGLMDDGAGHGRERRVWRAAIVYQRDGREPGSERGSGGTVWSGDAGGLADATGHVYGRRAR